MIAGIIKIDVNYNIFEKIKKEYYKTINSVCNNKNEMIFFPSIFSYCCRISNFLIYLYKKENQN